MKHAGEEALDRLEPLLLQLRRLPGLQERKRGTFYQRSAAFLHFHEDPAGCFGDLKIGGEFQRFPLHSANQRRAFLAAVRAAFPGSTERRKSR